MRLRVPAMDCADEVALVRRALEADPGVVHMAFDLVHSRVDLAIDPAQTSEARVREAIAPHRPGRGSRGRRRRRRRPPRLRLRPTPMWC